MANYGWDDLTIEFDDDADSLTDMSSYITEFNGVNISAITEEVTHPGSAWAQYLYTGIQDADEVTLTGTYDDTATTGPDAIFNSLGDTRTLKVTWGSTNTTSIETIISGYNRMPTVREVTKFEVTLRPTGAATEA